MILLTISGALNCPVDITDPKLIAGELKALGMLWSSVDSTNYQSQLLSIMPLGRRTQQFDPLIVKSGAPEQIFTANAAYVRK